MTVKGWEAPLLQTLRNHALLRGPVSSPDWAKLHLLDLSQFRLRFSSETPLISLVETVTAETCDDVAAAILDLERERGWQHKPCIVAVHGSGTHLRKSLAANPFASVHAVLDSTAISKVVDSRSPTSELLGAIRHGFPLALLAPYQTVGPATGSAFFGRSREMRYLVGRDSVNYAITGNRRIGKTSVLRELERRIIATGTDHSAVQYIDCSVYQTRELFVEEIVRRLSLRELPHLARRRHYAFEFLDFWKRMSLRFGTCLVVLLDEADSILSWPDGSAELLRVMRAASNSGYARFVIAGFRDIADEMSRSSSPLFMAFERLDLGPFASHEVSEMIAQPFFALGIRIKDQPEMEAAMVRLTGGLPQIVQACCLRLVERLDVSGNRVISPDDLMEVLRSEEFEEQHVRAFHRNVLESDRLLIYAVLAGFPDDQGSFSSEQAYGALKRSGLAWTPDEVDEACDRLVASGYLTREDGSFGFYVPLFSAIIRHRVDLRHHLAVARHAV